MQAAQGDLAAALTSFRNSLAITEHLAQSDPDNAEWQRDLAALYSEFADVYRQSGDTAAALAALRHGEEIMARLAELSPDNADWQRDLAWFKEQIAALAK